MVSNYRDTILFAEPAFTHDLSWVSTFLTERIKARATRVDVDKCEFDFEQFPQILRS